MTQGCLIDVRTPDKRRATQLVNCGGRPVPNADLSVDIVVVPGNVSPWLCRGSAFETYCRKSFVNLGLTDKNGHLDVDADQMLVGDLNAENPVVHALPPPPSAFNGGPSVTPTYRVVEATNARPLQKPEAFIDTTAIMDARDARLWAAAAPDRCAAPQDEHSCDGVNAYLSGAPNGAHRAQAQAARDNGTILLSELNERRSFAALNLRACAEAKESSTRESACGPLRAYERDFPSGPHVADVSSVLAAVGKREDAQRASEEKKAEDRVKKCFGSCYARCMVGRQDTRPNQLHCTDACTTFPPEAVCTML